MTGTRRGAVTAHRGAGGRRMRRRQLPAAPATTFLDTGRVGAYFAGLSGGSSAIGALSVKTRLLVPALVLLCCCGGQNAGNEGSPGVEGPTPGRGTSSAGPAASGSSGAGDTRVPGPAIGASPGRVLLIGIDAADESMIRPLVEAGRLPTLARFYREGTTGSLRSHEPMLSPILWTSIATGVSPTAHGVLDFIEIDSAGRTVPISSGARRSAAVWDVLGGRGVPVAVVGWLATWPATTVNGWLVTDRFTIHPFETPESQPVADLRGKCFPQGLCGEIGGLIARPEDLTRDEIVREFELPATSAGAPGGAAAEQAEAREERALAVVSSTTRTYAAAARWLEEEKGPAFEAVYFDGLDRLLHLFSDASLPPLPGSDPRRVARYGRVAEGFLVSLDRELAGLLKATGPDATVLVVSDHGWLTGDERPAVDPRRDGPFAADWHAPEGVLFALGPGVRRGVRIESADIYDVAPTLLALFGLPPARDFRGKPLTALFETPPEPATPPVDSYGPGPPAPGVVARGAAGAAGGSEAEAAVRNLRGLGYIGGGGGGGGGRQTGAVVDRSLSNLATVDLEEGRPEEAAGLYEKFLATSPDDYDSLYNLGWARRQMGDPDEARKAWLRAAGSRPSSAEPWISLAEMEAGRKHWPEVTEAAGKAAALDPDNARVWNLSAAAACEQGRMKECEDGFRKAIRLRPESAAAYVNLSRVLEAEGRGAEGIALVRQGLERAPGEPKLLARLEEMGGGG